VLWQLSIRCTEKAPAAHPIVHAQKLFRLMDSSQGRKRMASRHRTAAIVPPFVGCSMKDSAALSASGTGTHQSNIMQYLRKIMSTGPPSPSSKNGLSTPSREKNGEDFYPVRLMPDMTPPDGSFLGSELEDVIGHRYDCPGSSSKLSAATNMLKVDFEGCDHESSRILGKSPTKRNEKDLYLPRKQSKGCPACSKDTPPTPESIVFG
jgi:hypothetical protein